MRQGTAFHVACYDTKDTLEPAGFRWPGSVFHNDSPNVRRSFSSFCALWNVRPFIPIFIAASTFLGLGKQNKNRITTVFTNHFIFSYMFLHSEEQTTKTPATSFLRKIFA
jgi:hypothetical protein